MSAARTIKVISITDIGQPCAAPEIGTMAAPAIAFLQRSSGDAFAPPLPAFLSRPDLVATFTPNVSRAGADMLCSVQNAFLFGPYGCVVLPDGTIIQESVLRVDAVRLSQNFDQFKAMFPGEHVLWSHVT